MVHEIKVEGREIIRAPEDGFVANNRGVDSVRVSFDSDWDGLPVEATFSNGETVRTEKLIDGECEVPWEVLQEVGWLRVAFNASADGKAIVTKRMALPYYVEECGETGGEQSAEHASSVLAALVGRTITAYESDSTKTVGAYAFQGCTRLQSVALPNVDVVNTGAFRECTSLDEATLGAKTLGGMAFYGCKALLTLVLLRGSVCALGGTNAFTGTPIASGAGFVYVPDELVEDYKAAANWSTYADQIKPLSEYVES